MDGFVTFSPSTHTNKQRNKVMNPSSFFTQSFSTESSSQHMVPLPEGCVEEFPTTGGNPQELKARVKTIFPFDVQLLTLLGKEPEDKFSFFNPSIIASAEENKYFVALRESNFNFCPSRGVLRAPFQSKIHFGISDNPRGPVKFCSTFTDYQRGYTYNGPEDPHFFYMTDPRNQGEKVLHFTHVLGGTMHLSQVHFNNSGSNCTAKETNHLQMWMSGTNKNTIQKNWVFIPDSTTSDGRPLFVYKLNPLEVIAINMETGEGNTVSSQPKLDCVPNLRGYAVFLHHPTKPNVFIGIAHETVGKRRNYYSRVITVEEFEPQYFRLTGMSDRFGIPEHNDDICMHNTHYISSIMYADDNKETIIIGMGYMDCTPHTVLVKTSDLLSSVKPISCS